MHVQNPNDLLQTAVTGCSYEACSTIDFVSAFNSIRAPWLSHLRLVMLRCSRFRPTHPPSLSVGAARARLRASLPRRARLAPLRSPPRLSPT